MCRSRSSPHGAMLERWRSLPLLRSRRPEQSRRCAVACLRRLRQASLLSLLVCLLAYVLEAAASGKSPKRSPKTEPISQEDLEAMGRIHRRAFLTAKTVFSHSHGRNGKKQGGEPSPTRALPLPQAAGPSGASSSGANLPQASTSQQNPDRPPLVVKSEFPSRDDLPLARDSPVSRGLKTKASRRSEHVVLIPYGPHPRAALPLRRPAPMRGARSLHDFTAIACGLTASEHTFDGQACYKAAEAELLSRSSLPYFIVQLAHYNLNNFLRLLEFYVALRLPDGLALSRMPPTEMDRSPSRGNVGTIVDPGLLGSYHSRKLFLLKVVENERLVYRCFDQDPQIIKLPENASVLTPRGDDIKIDGRAPSLLIGRGEMYVIPGSMTMLQVHTSWETAVSHPGVVRAWGRPLRLTLPHPVVGDYPSVRCLGAGLVLKKDAELLLESLEVLEPFKLEPPEVKGFTTMVFMSPPPPSGFHGLPLAPVPLTSWQSSSGFRITRVVCKRKSSPQCANEIVTRGSLNQEDSVVYLIGESSSAMEAVTRKLVTEGHASIQHVQNHFKFLKVLYKPDPLGTDFHDEEDVEQVRTASPAFYNSFDDMNGSVLQIDGETALDFPSLRFDPTVHKLVFDSAADRNWIKLRKSTKLVELKWHLDSVSINESSTGVFTSDAIDVQQPRGETFWLQKKKAITGDGSLWILHGSEVIDMSGRSSVEFRRLRLSVRRNHSQLFLPTFYEGKFR